MKRLQIDKNKADSRIALKICKLLRRNDFLKLSHFLASAKIKSETKDDVIIKVHPDSVLNSKGQTGLHLACKFGHSDCVKVFLCQGASKRFQDKKGNIPLHFAIKFCMRQTHKKPLPIVRKMVESLVTKPFLDDIELIQTPNKRGTTPKILLDALNKTIYDDSEDDYNSTTDDDERQFDEKSWERRLREEEEVERFENFGKFEPDWNSDSFKNDYNETFDQWADRIHAEFTRLKDKNKPKFQKESKKEASKESPPRKVLKLKKLPKETTGNAKVKIKLEKLFNKNCQDPIRVKDLPFDEKTAQDYIISVLLEDKSKDRKSIKDVIRNWHPDKFSQMFHHRIDPEQRDDIIRIVTRVSQALLNFGKQ